VLQWVYDPSDFNTAGGLDAVPDEGGAQAAGSPPWQLELNAGATPQQVTVTDDDANFNEIGDPGQVLTNAVTINGITYPAGSRVVINYVITTADGFEGYSITLGSNNSGSNTTTAFITNTQMVPGQTYEFVTEGNIGRSNAFSFQQFACFVAGSLVSTPEGHRRIEDIVAGDFVTTKDHGPRPVRWTGQRMMPGIGAMTPVTFLPGVLGNARAVMVSPNHRMLVTGHLAQLYFGEEEILVPAKSLVNGRTVLRRPLGIVTYVHIMFEEHELIQTDGLWSESYFAGDQALADLAADQLQEILTLFPELRNGPAMAMSRPCSRVFEGRVLGASLLP